MANNEYINKVEYGNQTLMDITDTTAENGDVIEGQVFYAKNGARSVGTLGDATTSTHGLMSAADKNKLDGIAANANNYALPVMSNSVLGGAYIDTSLSSITIWHNPRDNKDILMLNAANSATIKAGTNLNQPATVFRQHESVFYGLSKVAGVDLANETVTLGTYPEASKTAIRSLIGAAAANDLSNKEDKTVVVTITRTQNQGNTTYTADKTFAEIAAAIEAGKTVMATTNYVGWHMYYKLADYGISETIPEDAFIRFSHESGQDAIYLDIRYDNTVEYSSIVLSTFYGISINGTHVYSNDGITNIPAASTDAFGVVKIGNGLGINSSSGKLQVNSSSSGNVKIGTDGYAPIVPGHQHESVFYGLSKVAGVNLANETVTLGTYPNTSKVAIRKMIDALGPSNIYDGLNLSEDPNSGDWVLSTDVQDVQINGASIVNNGVANIPVASASTLGVVKVSADYGIGLTNNILYIYRATDDIIKTATNNYRPIVPSTQDKAVYYGLSKLAGVDLANETVTVGTYPETSKEAIQTMLGTQAAIEVIRL